MDIEAPPRAQYIRTALFEMSRIANIVLFAGDMAPAARRRSPPASTPSATASTSSTRSRRPPAVASTRTSTASAASRTTCPRAGSTTPRPPWQKVRDFCDEIDDARHRQRDLRDPHPRASASSRPRSPSPTGSRAPTSGPRASTGTSAATAAYAGLVHDQLDWKVMDPPRRRLLRPLLGPRPGDPRGHQDRRPVPRRPAGRPDHGQGAPHHQGARGRGLRRDREPARRHGLLRRLQGRPRAVPGEDPHAELQQHLDRAVGAARASTSPTSSPSSPASTSSSGTSTGERPMLAVELAYWQQSMLRSIGRARRRAPAGRHLRLRLPVQDR